MIFSYLVYKKKKKKIKENKMSNVFRNLYVLKLFHFLCEKKEINLKTCKNNLLILNLFLLNILKNDSYDLSIKIYCFSNKPFCILVLFTCDLIATI